MIVKIYDPSNEMFEVPEARAAELVLNHGWTRQPITIVPVEETPVEIVEDDWRLQAVAEQALDEDDEADSAPAAEPERQAYAVVRLAPPRRRRK